MELKGMNQRNESPSRASFRTTKRGFQIPPKLTLLGPVTVAPGRAPRTFEFTLAQRK